MQREDLFIESLTLSQSIHSFPLSPGDAIQNARTALDFVAGLLWSKTNVGQWKGYFPIASGSEGYKSPDFLNRKVKGMREDFIEAISAIEPYKGGKGDSLWRLHELNIRDKHRLLVTVCGGNLGAPLPRPVSPHFPRIGEIESLDSDLAAQIALPPEKG